MAGPSEQTLLDTHELRLTTRRLITRGGVTYLLPQITSTRVEWGVQGTRPVAFFVILALGAVGWGGTGGFALAAGAVVAAALAWQFFKDPEHSLYLTTAAGEQPAITSRDRAFMLKLRDMLDGAIASGSLQYPNAS